MCGIFAFFDERTPISLNECREALCVLRQRGPDASGYYTPDDGLVFSMPPETDATTSLFLGNRRLSIQDPTPAGQQPMRSEDGDKLLVFNGEVYNYVELRNRLRRRGYDFESDCDTEVVLQAYEEYGTECVEHFRGMFAFAIWDATKREIIVARDRFGIKPLYVCWTERGIAVSSQVRALLRADVAAPQLDNRGVAGYLVFGFVPNPYTILNDVEVVSPGSVLRYDVGTGTADATRYYRPQYGKNQTLSPEEVWSGLRKSVEYRLRSDVPVGIFLSGGIDSAAIVAAADSVSDATDHLLQTFTLGFEESGYDERDRAAAVAEAFETDHISEVVDGRDVQKNLTGFISEMDQPMKDGLNTYFVSKLARSHDVPVTLSGLGADELFGGYHTFGLARRLRHLNLVKRLLPKSVYRPLGTVVETAGRWNDRLTLGRNPGKLGDVIRSVSHDGGTYMALRGLSSTSEVEQWSRVEAMGFADDFGRAVADEVEATGARNPSDAMSAAELRWFLHDNGFQSTDVMSMANSVEVRVPFLDSALADSIIGASTTRYGESGEKRILRETVRGRIPDAVTNADKTGFQFPLNHWLENELEPVVDRATTDRLLAKTPLKPDAVREARRTYRRSERVHSVQLWSLVVLSLWIDDHL